MRLNFDLLGDPIPENHGKPGANGHVPNAETASKIRTLLAARLPMARIAQEVGLSVPTMRKHYFSNGKMNVRHAREMAIAEARAKNLLQLQAAADEGNVTAMGKVRKILDEEERRILDDGWQRDSSKKTRRVAKTEVTPKGKKERDKLAALQAEEELDELFTRDNQVH